ncbi:hypothetical protein V7S43_002369 [Phytophthora oleae]|uniref:MtN3-like protein n=1 Tax=Phytophthora oleae TaxID=2107226 RepID=A0ABD3G5F9_9STRA
MRVMEVLSALTSLALICSPVIAMFRVFRSKDVGVASVIPLATLLANSHMWMLYGYMIKNWFPVFWVFLFGDVCGLLYLVIYGLYTPERRQFAHVLGFTLAVLFIATIYAVIGGYGYTGQTRGQVGSTVGILCDVVAVCLYGAPMEKLFQVLKYRSAVFINVHMVIASLANNVMWFTYGVLTDNWYIISPNTVHHAQLVHSGALFGFQSQDAPAAGGLQSPRNNGRLWSIRQGRRQRSQSNV